MRNPPDARDAHRSGFQVKKLFQAGLDFNDFQNQVGGNGFQNAIAHKHARTHVCAASCPDHATTGQLNGYYTVANLRHGADL
jgi:hypothetical protein